MAHVVANSGINNKNATSRIQLFYKMMRPRSSSYAKAISPPPSPTSSKLSSSSNSPPRIRPALPPTQISFRNVDASSPIQFRRSLNLILWCFFSSSYALLNKHLLTVFPFPVTLTVGQLTSGSLFFLACSSLQSDTQSISLNRIKSKHFFRLAYTSLFHAVGIVASHASIMASPSVPHVMIWRTGQPLLATLMSLPLGIGTSASVSFASLSYLGILLTLSRSTITGCLWTTCSSLAFSARGIATSRRLCSRRFGGGQALFWCLTMASLVWLIPLARVLEPTADVRLVWLELIGSGVLFYVVNRFAFDTLNQRHEINTHWTSLQPLLPNICIVLVSYGKTTMSPSFVACMLAFGGMWRYQCHKTGSTPYALDNLNGRLKAIRSMSTSSSRALATG